MKETAAGLAKIILPSGASSITPSEMLTSWGLWKKRLWDTGLTVFLSPAE